ncbi:hypothetical protein CYY_000940 [Polysphondylium violaceum]|uniref:SecA family profile domain-containing protein n=1 Tax=Polysphondylium violaceum TaxID=133409 RepID=A0A8J4Q0M5_9MYCE|nr:hypothetical protein CYY_000940 [Polysphondylium violaceum]
MIGSRFSDGLHEFIEVKHGLLPERDTLTAAAISHPSFFAMYNTIFGLTGTCGEDNERKELQQIYHVDTFDVPSYLALKRIKMESLMFPDAQEYQQRIVQEIKEMLALSRPVLLLLPTINDSHVFSQLVQKEEGIHRVQLLNEMQMENEEVIITRAGEPKTLTIATNTAGRGTDIKLTSEALAAGGLHVIFGFYPTNIRVEMQGLGRSGRQGQPGSCRLIISKKDMESASLGLGLSCFEEFDEMRSLKCSLLSSSRLRRSHVDQQQYLLLDKFFALLAAVKSYCTKEKLVSLIQKSQSSSSPHITCACTPMQTTKIRKSLAFQNLYEASQKLDSSNTSSIETFATRLQSTINEYLLQEWADLFTSSFSNLSTFESTLENFDQWWISSSAQCFESNLEYHIITLIHLSKQ